MMPTVEQHIDLYKYYCNTVNEIYYSVDARGRIDTINEAFTHLTGYGNEILGRHFLILIAPHERRDVLRFIREHLPTEEHIVRAELMTVRKDGSPMWVEQQTRILRDGNNRPVQFQSIARDITPRVQQQHLNAALRTTLQSLNYEDSLLGSLQSLCRRIDEDLMPHAVTCMFSHHDTPFHTEILHLQHGQFTKDGLPHLFRDLFVSEDHPALFQDRTIVTRIHSRLTLPFSGPVSELLFPSGQSTLLTSIAPVINMKSLDVAFLVWKKRGSPFNPFELSFLRSFTDIIGSAVERIAARDTIHRLYQESLRSKERQELLARRLIEIQDRERRTIAHEIHDELGQLLTLAKITVEKMTKPGISALDLKHLKGLNDTITEGLHRVRTIAQDLHPSVLNDLGLIPALHALAEKVQDRTNCAVMIDHDDAHLLLDAEKRLALYRVIQEAITNSLRHGKASEIRITILRHLDRICISIHDNGTGFTTDRNHRTSNGIGLIGMEERIHHSNGSFTITSSARSGTQITIHFPLEKSNAHEQHFAAVS